MSNNRYYKKIILKSDTEIALMRENGRIIAKLFAHFKEIIKPGISTLELDKIAEEFIASHKAIPSFKGYGGFPGSICASVNDVVIHGIPSKDTILKDGDIIGVDIGVLKNGFHADSAFTFTVGTCSTQTVDLLEATKHSLALGISAAREGKTLFDIANNIQTYLDEKGYGIITDFVGHGVGKDLHEPPQVPNYRVAGLSKIKLHKGMVLAIEPMTSIGKSGEVKVMEDDWTVKTVDGSLAAHFEHTVAITEKGPLILTDL